MSDIRFTQHFFYLVPALRNGLVIPFLGAGANLSGLPSDDQPYDVRSPAHRPPLGGELAGALADQNETLKKAAKGDLLKVAQSIDLFGQRGFLEGQLRSIFDQNFPIPPLQNFLAKDLLALLRKHKAPYPLIITTNYDDLLERAFDEAGEPYDVVYYAVNAREFVHKPSAQAARPIPVDSANEYEAVSPEILPVILKLHGTINRTDKTQDSYVITEDDYLNYLARINTPIKIPVHLKARMTQSHFLFLGYSLTDWNLRLILYQLWEQKTLPHQSWSIQYHPLPPTGKRDDAAELALETARSYWRRYNVDVFEEVKLEDYLETLRRHLDGGS